MAWRRSQNRGRPSPAKQCGQQAPRLPFACRATQASRYPTGAAQAGVVARTSERPGRQGVTTRQRMLAPLNLAPAAVGQSLTRSCGVAEPWAAASVEADSTSLVMI